jgi:sarcosine dehydrogenase
LSEDNSARPSNAIDLWPLDIRCFSTTVHRARSWLEMRGVEAYGNYYKMHYPGKENHSGRDLRHSSIYEQTKQQGAVFGSKFGWERPLYFARDGSKPILEHEANPSFNRRQDNAAAREWDFIRTEHMAA